MTRFAYFALVSLAFCALATRATADDVILYQRTERLLVDSKWGRLAELQTGLNTVLAGCGADPITVDGRFGAKAFAALAAAAACKHWPANSARAITVANWQSVFGSTANAAHAMPSVEDRAFALVLAHEATDFDRLVWNYGTKDHAGATWGPFGATADFGNEIRGILARIDNLAPALIDEAFGTEATFVRDTYLRSLGAHDGYDLLDVVHNDPVRRDIWVRAFTRLAADARARASFLWYALESPNWLRPGLQMAYELIPRADRVLDVLRAEIGASAQQYLSEDEFLNGTHKMLKDILSDPDGYLDSWNYLDTVDPKRFAAGVSGLISQIEEILKVPQDQRGETA